MDKTDVMEAVLMWVLGMCYNYNEEMGIFAVFRTSYDSMPSACPSEVRQCTLWVEDCQNKTWRYLNGKQELDASCSDFQCHIAIKAKQIFGKHFKE